MNSDMSYSLQHVHTLQRACTQMCAPTPQHPPKAYTRTCMALKTSAPDRRSEHHACAGAYAKQAPRHQRTHPRTRSPRRLWHEFRHAILSAKNAHAPVHARLCNRAETSLPWKLLRTYLESCASIVQAVFADRPAAVSTKSVAQRWVTDLSPNARRPNRSRNPSKSTLAHDSVAAAVSHKHHSIIRVGAGLILFVYGRTCSSAAHVISNENLFPPFFPASFFA